MSVLITGISDVERVIARVDRKLTKERQTIIKRAATKTLVPAVRSRAKAQVRGKAGPLMARYTTARVGKNGAVVVGPRTGKGRAWWRHYFIAGVRTHVIGAKPTASGRRRFLYNPAAVFAAAGPVRHPGLPGSPVVERGVEDARVRFIAAVSDGLFTDKGGS